MAIATHIPDATTPLDDRQVIPGLTSPRSSTALETSEGTPTASADPSEFEQFSAALSRLLVPTNVLERMLVDRVIVAAWQLQRSTRRETAAHAVVLTGESTGDASSSRREARQAERRLGRALELLDRLRTVLARPAAFGPPATASGLGMSIAATRHDPAPVEDDDYPDYSNEWPSLGGRPVDESIIDGPFGDEVEEDDGTRWEDRLLVDPNVSQTSPVVRGTWVTVRQVVSLIVDGWTWSEVLRNHPELTEADIRACLAFTVDQDEFSGL